MPLYSCAHVQGVSIRKDLSSCTTSIGVRGPVTTHDSWLGDEASQSPHGISFENGELARVKHNLHNNNSNKTKKITEKHLPLVQLQASTCYCVCSSGRHAGNGLFFCQNWQIESSMALGFQSFFVFLAHCSPMQGGDKFCFYKCNIQAKTGCTSSWIDSYHFGQLASKAWIWHQRLPRRGAVFLMRTLLRRRSVVWLAKVN